MTFDDDFVRLNFNTGVRTITCKALGLEWPPPERITKLNVELVRVSYSQVTDEQRAGMTHVCRGAQYERADEVAS